ncbi:CDP-diacylglycerol diphosphatase [Streptomyces sp. NRRL WC-3618]|uniref:CDP-diacylglycerol diphosphatase n=1 Tax=Streptomyces sp. NRRL WC-3618 TaxID=1519490 RepID=UPI00099D3BC5|nr:CDP-diacylglycerol diphosphatase [Streptomyces sp. NRRL WC-3618]
MYGTQPENTPASRLDPKNCGEPGDHGPRDGLWLKVQECISAGNCVDVDKAQRCAVMHGGLVVPIDRVKGIECYTIWQLGAPNYWHSAWEYVCKHMPPASTGLGINSKSARTKDQLHIHMADFHERASGDLVHELKGQQGNMAPHSGKSWAESLVTATGWVAPAQKWEQRKYRAQHVPNLGSNLFETLQKEVAPGPERMQEQTMIVIPASQGFYVLNSEKGIRDGTSTCDYLLRCN